MKIGNWDINKVLSEDCESNFTLCSIVISLIIDYNFTNWIFNLS